MATLQKRKRIYYIVFSKRINGKLYQKKFTLKTKNKKVAERKKVEFEELYSNGEIDPFGGWTPKMHRLETKKSNENSQIVTLKDLSEKFVDERSQANQVSKDNYSVILRLLKNEVGETLPVSMITQEDVRKICFKKGLSPSSQSNYLRHLKVFFNWLLKNGYTKHDVTKSIKKPKTKHNISKKIIDENGLKEIFKKYRQDIMEKKKERIITKEFQSRVWFRPVVMTAFYAGLRRKEILSLTWDNVSLEREQIIVTDTKSGKERSIPIRKKLLSILKAWHRFHNKPTKGLVFPSKKAFYENSKMSGNNISKVFKHYVTAAKLGDNINFHGLRHSCITELLRLGFDINEVAKIAGHSSLEVTKKYEHLTRTDLGNKMKKLEKDDK